MTPYSLTLLYVCLDVLHCKVLRLPSLACLSVCLLQLWQNFFQLAVAFTCQLPLQLEVISEVKRNRIMDSYGDMRIAMNSLMLNKWKALGSYQSRYVPGMIGPFLKVSLLPHTSEFNMFGVVFDKLSTTLYTGIRRNTIPIFFDMMETEFKYRKNFHMVC